MYNQIKKDIEKLATMQKRSIELTEKIKKKETEMAELEKAKSRDFPSVFLSLPHLSSNASHWPHMRLNE